MRSRVVWIVSLGILLALLSGNLGSAGIEGAYDGISSRDVQSGLLAYWKLDEGNGTAIGDSSGNGFEGNAYMITWHWGVRGHAVYFPNSDSSVNITGLADYIKNNGIKSVAHAAWFKMQYPRVGQITGEKDDHIHSELQMESDGRVHFWMEDPSDADYMVYSNGSLADNEWHFVVGQYNYTTKTMEIWVDGILQERKTYDFEPSTNISTFFIGYGDSGSFHLGYVDEVRIYGRTLSGDEIRELYREKLPVLRINSDQEMMDFASAHDLPGVGSESDPYIISEFDIDAQGGSVGIFMGNVTLHVEITDIAVGNTTSSSGEYGSGEGIYIFNSSNITIMDVEFHDIATSAVRIRGSSGIAVEGNRIEDSSVQGSFIEAIYSRNVIIRNNVLDPTVYRSYRGIDLEFTPNSTITENTVRNFTRDIYVVASPNTTVSNNVMEGRTSFGLDMENSDNSTIVSNVVIGDSSMSWGIQALDCSNSTIAGNTVTGGEGGIVYTGSHSEIYSNIVKNSAYNGMASEYSHYNVFRDNLVINSTWYGMHFDSTTSGNVIYGNVFKLNNGTTGRYNASRMQAYDAGTNNWSYNHAGNYWMDWARNNETNDGDGDGIVDYPYLIGGGAMDPYPLKYQPHGPIWIEGDSQMEEFAREEFLQGNGTPGDPYIIDYFAIDAKGAGNAIMVKDVTYHVVIRNNVLHNATHEDEELRGGDGIRLYRVSGAVVENNTIYDVYYGISLRYGSNITVRNNRIWSVEVYGLNIYKNPGNTIEGNALTNTSILLLGNRETFVNETIVNNTVNGRDVVYVSNVTGVDITGELGEVIIAGSTDIRVDNVSVENGCIGVLAGYSDGIRIANSTLRNFTAYGIRLVVVKNTTVEKNLIKGAHRDGILIQSESDSVYSSNITVRRNNITSCSAGVHIFDYSRNNTLAYNYLADNGDGVYIQYAPWNYVLNNTIVNNYHAGVRLYYHISGGIIAGNVMIANNQGIYASEYVSGFIMEKNTINESDYGGILAVRVQSTVIRGNFLYHNHGYGVQLSLSSGVLVYNNSFYYNHGSTDSYDPSHTQAYDDANNLWNTTSFGNFWSDWNSTSPYVFENNKDYHPYASYIEPAVPLSPGNLVATVGDGFVNLSWSRPAGNGSSPIISYRIYRNGTLLVEVPASQTWYNDTSVVNGITYTYTVTAVNSAGESEKSNEVTATPHENIPEGIHFLAILGILILLLVRRR